MMTFAILMWLFAVASLGSSSHRKWVVKLKLIMLNVTIQMVKMVKLPGNQKAWLW
jgi:hypothetical protein